MTIETTKYARKPFYVDAVQVTAENMEEVAKWCQGSVQLNDKDSKNFIKVRVHRPLTEKQTEAYVGDWVLYAGTGYKVYTDKAFHNSFEKVDDTIRHRSAKSGEYVSAEEAAANPDTTVAEQD